jgi:foldase protein PrsA
MSLNQKKLLVSIVVGILALGVVGCGLFVKVAATVDGEKITVGELDKAINRIALAHPESPIPKEKKEARLRVLNFLIDDIIYQKEAQKLGIKVSDKQVDAELNKTKKKFPSEADFARSLKDAGVTMTDFRDSIRIRLLREVVNEKIVGKVKVSEKQVREYYENNKKQFKPKPEQVKIGFVQVETQEEAQDVLAKIRAGMDFDDAMRKFSIDPSIKSKGVQTRFVEPGRLTRLSPRLDELAFSLPAGEVTEPVETPVGWLLMKVYEKKAGTRGTYEEVKEDITKMLKISKWITDARKKAKVKIYL